MKTLTLIRGLPGSGKTTLATKSRFYSTAHIEADDYFYDDYGNYVFDPTKLQEAHDWCQKNTRRYLEEEFFDGVNVSNTFTTLSEMKPYYLLAKELGAELNVITCQGSFGSVHDVPQETYDKMKKRFFHGDVIKELEKLYGI